ncbi:hypothetical protein [Zhongshania aliphaticivorans]|uniref:hypothetical protein n=1 Tax=Zhongshania aliphaticivorans TaxID=1470434 RepID=UPI0012E506C9|nr:hypothetical protein [Zhongshania aliphaticivorans]CAA0103280.1 Uncharacterised protein [Zhongshania aliphaticivorans]
MNPDLKNHLNNIAAQVVAVMEDRDLPMGSAALAEALNMPHDQVQAAVMELVICNRLIWVGRCENQRPVYLLRVTETLEA